MLSTRYSWLLLSRRFRLDRITSKTGSRKERKKNRKTEAKVTHSFELDASRATGTPYIIGTEDTCSRCEPPSARRRAAVLTGLRIVIEDIAHCRITETVKAERPQQVDETSRRRRQREVLEDID